MPDCYFPLRAARSDHLLLNNHLYHVQHWGADDAPLLFLLHGWMDCAASFQFLADCLPDWHIIAPDWRGFGGSAWNADGYYAPDYLADLDALLTHYSPHAAANVVGHSMGAMISGLYAGIRPQRVARLALVEGFGLSQTRPAEAPGRYARWLREKEQPPAYQPLGTLAAVARRLQERNPHLSADRAQFMAQALTHQPATGLTYRADPRHKMVNPVLYRLEEAKACWQRIACPVQWVMGDGMADHAMAKGVFDTLDERRACFADLREAVVAQAGHMVQWDQPARLAAILQSFFTDDQSV